MDTPPVVPGPGSSPGPSSGSSPVVIALGDVATDLVVRLHEPLAVASDTRTTIAVRPGGSGANQAAWLAFSGLEAHFVGCVGRDPFGAYHREELQRAGVAPHLGRDSERSTGLIVVLVDPLGERSMLADRGANLGLRRDDLPLDLFHAGACLHLSGYTLFEPQTRQVARAALRLARARGLTVSVDPASASFLAAVGPDRFLEWTQGADLCFPNLDEGRLLSGLVAAEDVARALCRWYGEVALKRGADGALWAGRDQPLLSLPAAPVAVVDSTGAGDAFCAGFLARRLVGAQPEDALAAGLRLAAAAVARVGARPSSSEL